MKKPLLLLISVFITLLFFVAGVNHFQTMKESVSFLSSKYPFNKLPNKLNYIIICISNFIEVSAILLITFGIMFERFYFIAKYAAYALALFLICSILFIHNPFFYKDEFHPFLKNLSILGGVLLLANIV